MKDGYVKVAAATPYIHVADCVRNREEIAKSTLSLASDGARVIVFPEMCITGYTVGDLLWQPHLLETAERELLILADETKGADALIFVGLPYENEGKLYNVAAVLCRGRILAFIPKTYLPTHNEFYERRYFTPGERAVRLADFHGQSVPFGTDVLFRCAGMPHLTVAAEICEDVWAPSPPSVRHSLAGATVIVNLSASNEVIGKDDYRRELVSGQSARLVCGYIYASCGDGESTGDLVFSAHNMIAEYGTVLAEAELFKNEAVTSEIDVDRIVSERRRSTSFPAADAGGYTVVPFELPIAETALTRRYDPRPYVPSDASERGKRCDRILTMQAMGLKKRLAHTNCKSAVIGISGGLDSTLALLVTSRAFDMLGLPREDILAVTMPCFGTTDRTYNNACRLVESIGASLREIRIEDAVRIHFRDIGHDESVRDVTYENSQARERTQILMDLANQTNGLVIGTGDLSELALGWATYNGDHMSMYGVNSSVPKTLVRHLVSYFADTCGSDDLAKTLRDILDTPVSPELLPPENGTISQKTEDLVGPYELHDFFLYYLMRAGFPPKKIFRIACRAFDGEYDRETILRWEKTFYRRFFSQQFKRSCLPDGPKVGSVALSPRGDWRMPSDASVRIWMDELDEI